MKEKAEKGMDGWLKNVMKTPADEKPPPQDEVPPEVLKERSLTDLQAPRACVPVWPRERQAVAEQDL